MQSAEKIWLRGIEGDAARDLIESKAPVIRVVAGPGSGKTTCLKRRTQRLVEGDDVDPESMFVGTLYSRNSQRVAGGPWKQCQSLNPALICTRATTKKSGGVSRNGHSLPS